MQGSSITVSLALAASWLSTVTRSRPSAVYAITRKSEMVAPGPSSRSNPHAHLASKRYPGIGKPRASVNFTFFEPPKAAPYLSKQIVSTTILRTFRIMSLERLTDCFFRMLRPRTSRSSAQFAHLAIQAQMRNPSAEFRENRHQVGGPRRVVVRRRSIGWIGAQLHKRATAAEQQRKRYFDLTAVIKVVEYLVEVSKSKFHEIILMRCWHGSSSSLAERPFDTDSRRAALGHGSWPQFEVASAF